MAGNGPIRGQAVFDLATVSSVARPELIRSAEEGLVDMRKGDAAAGTGQRRTSGVAERDSCFHGRAPGEGIAYGPWRAWSWA